MQNNNITIRQARLRRTRSDWRQITIEIFGALAGLEPQEAAGIAVTAGRSA